MLSKSLLKLICALSLFLSVSVGNVFGQNDFVTDHGKIQAEGNRIIDRNGYPIQLRGMSFFWSQWIGKYYRDDVVNWLVDDWECTIVRAAMGIDADRGYLYYPDTEREKIETVVDAAIEKGIYVIIDWHSHDAHNQTEDAKIFFAEMAQKYGEYPNVIYELYNEPVEATWSDQIKPYCEAVIDTIRHHDPDNLIICGTRQWSQLVSEAAEDPINDTNVAYTLHYYAATHKNSLRSEARYAIYEGIPLFVTEFGVCESNGNGVIDYEESEKWWEFLDANYISWCNWSVADKNESASALDYNASTRGGWEIDDLRESGVFVRAELKAKRHMFSPPATPFSDVPSANTDIEAEEYDKGNIGIAYSDGTHDNDGDTLRNDDVDIYVMESGDGFYVSDIEAGEWLQYSVSVLEDGYYNFSFNVRSEVDAIMHILVDGVVVDTVSINPTTDWEMITGSSTSLNSGNHKIRLYFVEGGFDIDNFSFAKIDCELNPEACVGIDEQEFEAGEIAVKPNPFNGSMIVEAPQNSSYTIYDLTGRAVESGQCSNQCEVGTDIHEGFYLLRITNGEKVASISVKKN